MHKHHSTYRKMAMWRSNTFGYNKVLHDANRLLMYFKLCATRVPEIIRKGNEEIVPKRRVPMPDFILRIHLFFRI